MSTTRPLQLIIQLHLDIGTEPILQVSHHASVESSLCGISAAQKGLTIASGDRHAALVSTDHVSAFVFRYAWTSRGGSASRSQLLVP